MKYEGAKSSEWSPLSNTGGSECKVVEKSNKSVTALITLLNLADIDVQVNASIGEDEIPVLHGAELCAATKLVCGE